MSRDTASKRMNIRLAFPGWRELELGAEGEVDFQERKEEGCEVKKVHYKAPLSYAYLSGKHL